MQGDTALGIDLGIKLLAVYSDGRTFDNPKNLQHSLDRLALLQKRLSRKKKGSANRNKARIRVARLQEHIANSRKDSQIGRASLGKECSEPCRSRWSPYH